MDSGRLIFDIAPGSQPWSLPIKSYCIPNMSWIGCSMAMDGTEPFTTPALDVVSLYVDQRGEGNLSQERADRRNFPCREQSGTNLPTRVETRN